MAGRPLKFETPEILEEKINKYFEDRKANNLPFTITGLALALDTTRELLCNYEERDEFRDTVKKAKLRCEDYAETQLFIGKNQAGSIFALKNYGWKDKNETDITTQGDKIQSGVIVLPQRNGNPLESSKETDSSPSEN